MTKLCHSRPSRGYHGAEEIPLGTLRTSPPSKQEAPAGVAHTETAWLVELTRPQGCCLYLRACELKSGRHDLVWDPDPNKAIRFARQQDAEAVIPVMLSLSDGREMVSHAHSIIATEHMRQDAPAAEVSLTGPITHPAKSHAP